MGEQTRAEFATSLISAKKKNCFRNNKNFHYSNVIQIALGELNGDSGIRSSGRVERGEIFVGTVESRWKVMNFAKTFPPRQHQSCGLSRHFKLLLVAAQVCVSIDARRLNPTKTIRFRAPFSPIEDLRRGC